MGFGEPNLGQLRGVAGWVAEAIARVEHPSRERQRRPARVSSRDGLRAARLEDRDHCLRTRRPWATSKCDNFERKDIPSSHLELIIGQHGGGDIVDDNSFDGNLF
jgi:hypothetical protein